METTPRHDDALQDAAVSLGRHSRELTLTLAGILAVAGSFLPWAKATVPLVGSISTSGMDGGDGWVSVILGVAAIGFALAALRTGRLAVLRIAAAATGSIVLALGVYEWVDISHRLSGLAADGVGIAGHGVGLDFLFIAAVLALVTAVTPVRQTSG